MITKIREADKIILSHYLDIEWKQKCSSDRMLKGTTYTREAWEDQCADQGHENFLGDVATSVKLMWKRHCLIDLVTKNVWVGLPKAVYMHWRGRSQIIMSSRVNGRSRTMAISIPWINHPTGKLGTKRFYPQGRKEERYYYSSVKFLGDWKENKFAP